MRSSDWSVYGESANTYKFHGMRAELTRHFVIGNRQIFDALTRIAPEKHILFFENGQQVIDFVSNQSIDFPPILILDQDISDVSAKDCLEKIRKNLSVSHSLVYLLFNSLEIEEVKIAFAHNCAGLINKPTNSDGYDRIANVLKNFWDICVLG